MSFGISFLFWCFVIFKDFPVLYSWVHETIWGFICHTQWHLLHIYCCAGAWNYLRFYMPYREWYLLPNCCAWIWSAIIHVLALELFYRSYLNLICYCFLIAVSVIFCQYLVWLSLLCTCRDAFVDYWVNGNMLTKDIATQIFIIFKQPDFRYLTQVLFVLSALFYSLALLFYSRACFNLSSSIEML